MQTRLSYSFADLSSKIAERENLKTDSFVFTWSEDFKSEVSSHPRAVGTLLQAQDWFMNEAIRARDGVYTAVLSEALERTFRPGTSLYFCQHFGADRVWQHFLLVKNDAALVSAYWNEYEQRGHLGYVDRRRSSLFERLEPRDEPTSTGMVQTLAKPKPPRPYAVQADSRVDSLRDICQGVEDLLRV